AWGEAMARCRRGGTASAWGDELGGNGGPSPWQRSDGRVRFRRTRRARTASSRTGDTADPRLALCVDVLAPDGYGEIIGGGQREEDLATLEARIAEHDLPREAFDWYLDLRRFGSVPHAGFGMGIERCVGWLCGLHHVRETIPFPRMLERLRP